MRRATAKSPPVQNRWTQAYGVAFANATLFFILSSLSISLGMSIPINLGIDVVFMFGSLVAATLLMRAGEGPVAIGMFVLGTGLIFGFGTFYGVMGPTDFIGRILFPPTVQEVMLGKINLVNSLSVLCVLAFAWPMSSYPAREKLGSGVVEGVQRLRRYQGALIFASVVIIGAVVATFPAPENLIYRNWLSILAKIPLVVIVMVTARWREQSLAVKTTMLLMLFVLVGVGVISSSKSSALIPVAAVVGGLWINRGTRPAAVVVVILSMITYFTLLEPLSGNIRAAYGYDNGRAGLRASVDNFSTGVKALQAGQKNTSSTILKRFSSTPYQSYLISQYENGNRGSSLDDFWAAAIPRALWRDKPTITRFGAQLYGSVNRTRYVESQLAPTYSAEAFWNYGWWGVIAVSALIGVELGWFTRKWLLLASGRSRRMGILVFTVPVAYLSLFVEAWIAAAYIGGFLTLFLLIVGIDVASAYLERSAPKPAPKRLAPGNSAAVMLRHD